MVKGERSLETVYRALDLVPYREALEPFSRVLIKVNFITTKNWETGATTDPLVVEALINRVRDLGKEPLVVESDAQMTNADMAMVASGRSPVAAVVWSVSRSVSAAAPSLAPTAVSFRIRIRVIGVPSRMR